MKPIKELENIHQGEDIYIVAAGKSGDFLDPDFLVERIAIGVNQSYKRFKSLNYIVKKDGLKPHEKELRIPFIVSKNLYGGGGKPNEGGTYFFEHHVNGAANINFADLHPVSDKIVVSYSTITSAIHLAAFMGAKTIFLIGHDCATLDGQSSFTGYHEGIPSLWGSVDAYNDWLSVIWPQTVAVREYITTVYGCSVYSINPFIGLDMEGHLVGGHK